jgi:hypothetical protein
MSAVTTRRREPWTPAELKLLGEIPDSVFAKRYRRSLKQVVAMREHRGIGQATAPRRWTAREIKLLGKMNDHELARRLRRSHWNVAQQRKDLKIAPFKPRARWRFWKPSELKLLGTMPDDELARKLRRSLASIQVERVRRGIQLERKPGGLPPDHLKLLGKVSDEELARISGFALNTIKGFRYKHTKVRLISRHIPLRPHRAAEQWSEQDKLLLRQFADRQVAIKLRCSITSVRAARQKFFGKGFHAGLWTPEEEAFVGAMPDQELALRLNRSLVAIVKKRCKLGIRRPHPRFRPWTKEEDALLGTMPDRDLAQQLGRTSEAVKVRRRKHGVEKHGEGEPPK